MNSLIFRALSPIIFAIMMVFSIFVLLRGHNEPGGGFIGGLIGASGVSVYAMACGVPLVRKALRIDPLALAGIGVLCAGLAGLLSVFVGKSFLSGLWAEVNLGEAYVSLSTPLLFDLGVYLVVFGTLSAIALALQDDEEVS